MQYITIKLTINMPTNTDISAARPIVSSLNIGGKKCHRGRSYYLFNMNLNSGYTRNCRTLAFKKKYTIYFIYFTPKHKMLRPKLNSCVYHIKSLAPPPGTLLNRRYIWYTVG